MSLVEDHLKDDNDNGITPDLIIIYEISGTFAMFDSHNWYYKMRLVALFVVKIYLIQTNESP